jgi:hypothetical protein
MTHSISRFSLIATATTALFATDLAAGETRPLMTLEVAKMAADACEKYQVENDLPKLNIAVVDRGRGSCDLSTPR